MKVFGGYMLGWALTRTMLLALLAGPQLWISSDVFYYRANLQGTSASELGATLTEYPLPALAVVGAPLLFAKIAGGADYYLSIFVMAALSIDLLYQVALLRAGPRTWGPRIWLLAVPMFGVTTLVRFDLVPGVLCGLALLVAGSRPGRAGLYLGLAVLVKLWPVLLIGSIAAAAKRKPRFLGSLGLTLLLIGLACAWLAGIRRLISPFLFLQARGLQVESVAATPAIIAAEIAPRNWTIALAPASRSIEIAGPQVGALLMVTSIASLLLMLGVLLTLWKMSSRMEPVMPEAAVWVSLAFVTTFIATGKVFSPQYLLWLLPLVAAGAVVCKTLALKRWAVGILVVSALTQTYFEYLYPGFMSGDPSLLATGILMTRNILVVALLVDAIRQILRLCRGVHDDRVPCQP